MSPHEYDDFLSPELGEDARQALGYLIPVINRTQNLRFLVTNATSAIEGKNGLIGQVANAFGVQLSAQDFLHQIVELKEKDILPQSIASDLHHIRTLNNLAKHPDKGDNITLKQLQTFRDLVVEVYEWYYCKCPNGPKLKSIFIPKTIALISVGHVRTVFSTARVSSVNVLEVKPPRVKLSDEFFTSHGFKAFLAFYEQLRDVEHIDGFAVALAAHVEEDGHIEGLLVNVGNWPARLALDFRNRYTTTRSSLTNDVVAYANGCAIGSLTDPILVLTMGHGIGCAIIRRSEGRVGVEGIELGPLPIRDGKNVHQYIGGEFFREVAPQCGWEYKKVRERLSKRFARVLDVLRSKEAFKSVIVGGGRSPYLDVRTVLDNCPWLDGKIEVQSDDIIPMKGLALCWHEKHYPEPP